MRVLVTGATGFIGSAVVRHLLEHGHEVLGLARSEEAATKVSTAGSTPIRGSIKDVDTLRRAVDQDAVGGPRGATEHAIDELSAAGSRACAVRLPPIVHGDGDHGFLPRLIGIATTNKVWGYAGDGSNRWPSAHRYDAARLFVTALEKGQTGARYHGVADEGVPFLDIASAVGRHLDVPVEPATPRQVKARFSFLASFLGADNPTSGALTTDRLGWTPSGPSLLEDIEAGTYFRTRMTA